MLNAASAPLCSPDLHLPHSISVDCVFDQVVHMPEVMFSIMRTYLQMVSVSFEIGLSMFADY